MLSVYTLKQVYAAFRGAGHTVADVKRAAAREGVTAATRV